MQQGFGAAYYRLVQNDNGSGKIVAKYYVMLSDVLVREAECSAVEPEDVYDGKVINYYRNGKVEDEGIYVAGKKHGRFKYFRESGAPLREMIYKNGGEGKYAQYWSKTGEPVIDHGKGILLSHDEKTNETSRAEFLDSMLVVSYVIRHSKKDSIYSGGIENPYFKDGYATLYKKMGEYPKEARRKNIEGTVLIRFVVSREGKLEEIELDKGIGSGCDEVALDCVKKCTNGWVPAMYKGKPVKSQAILPFAFKLQ
jgi:TonB family protein